MRKGDWIDKFNVKIVSFADRPDLLGNDETVYVVKDIFTTRDGSWEPGKSDPGAVQQWARDTYLRAFSAPDYFDDAGADHHLFSRVEAADGKHVVEAPIVYWSDGLGKLEDPRYDGYVNVKTKERSGWGNVVLSPGANYYPDQGKSGPWSMKVKGASEIVTGLGMPVSMHVSFFVVWQAVPRSQVVGATSALAQVTAAVTAAVGSAQAAISAGVGVVVSGASAILETPDVPADPPKVYPEGVSGIRQAAWDTVGINYNPEAAFSRYAREHGLAIPLTNEFDVNGYRCQGFVGGIVYAKIGDWGNVQHATW